MADSPWDPSGPDYGMNAGAFLDDPRLRTALLSSGLALMGTPQWGQNVTSQLASAIGTGGEAVAHQEAMDIKKQEAQSKEELRAAQANVAGARSGREADRLAYQIDALKTRGNVQTLGQYVAYQNGINAANAKIRAYNANVALTGQGTPVPEKPLLPYDQFVAQNPGLAGAGIGTGTPTPGTPVGGDLIQEGRAAIARAKAAGKDIRPQVEQRLRERGVDPSLLGDTSGEGE